GADSRNTWFLWGESGFPRAADIGGGTLISSETACQLVSRATVGNVGQRHSRQLFPPMKRVSQMVVPLGQLSKWDNHDETCLMDGRAVWVSAGPYAFRRVLKEEKVARKLPAPIFCSGRESRPPDNPAHLSILGRVLKIGTTGPRVR